MSRFFMSRFMRSAIASACLLVLSGSALSQQATSPSITTPTVVIRITHLAPLGAPSRGAFTLYNANGAYSIDAKGNITVRAPTDIPDS